MQEFQSCCYCQACDQTATKDFKKPPNPAFIHVTAFFALGHILKYHSSARILPERVIQALRVCAQPVAQLRLALLVAHFDFIIITMRYIQRQMSSVDSASRREGREYEICTPAETPGLPPACVDHCLIQVCRFGLPADSISISGQYATAELT